MSFNEQLGTCMRMRCQGAADPEKLALNSVSCFRRLYGRHTTYLSHLSSSSSILSPQNFKLALLFVDYTPTNENQTIQLAHSLTLSFSTNEQRSTPPESSSSVGVAGFRCPAYSRAPALLPHQARSSQLATRTHFTTSLGASIVGVLPKMSAAEGALLPPFQNRRRAPERSALQRQILSLSSPMVLFFL